MDIRALHQFVASVPGTFGERFSRQMAVNMVAAGNHNAAASLVSLAGLGAIPALVAAGAPAPTLRIAIETAVRTYYRELPWFIEQCGGRAVFAAWCRQAEFTGSETLPETVDLYRGTMGCSPADAATGLHWSLSFDDAAYYACRFADTDLTGVIVLHARVPRDGIVAVISGTAHQEVVPAEAPASFEVITDKERVGDAAVRTALRCQALKAQGWKETGSVGIVEQAAMQTRARMAAAGVPRGTAIVA